MTNPTPTPTTKSEIVANHCAANNIPHMEFVPAEVQVALYSILMDATNPTPTREEREADLIHVARVMAAFTARLSDGHLKP